jgi:hypothetical protein
MRLLFFFLVLEMESGKESGLSLCSFFSFSSLARCTLLSFAYDFSGYKYLPLFYPKVCWHSTQRPFVLPEDMIFAVFFYSEIVMAKKTLPISV